MIIHIVVEVVSMMVVVKIRLVVIQSNEHSI